MVQLQNQFDSYSSSLFFNDRTYADLLNDVCAFSEKIQHTESFGLKTQSAYLTFVGILSAMKEKKTAVLLSHLEKEKGIEEQKEQFGLTMVFEDSHFEEKICTDRFPKIDPDQHSTVVLTSGSSGKPKGIVLTLNNFFHSAKGFIEFFDLKNTETSFLNLPHHHVGGLMILWRAFFSGGRVTTLPHDSFDCLSLVPTQLSQWMNDEEKLKKLKAARIILIGGAKYPEALREKAQGLGLLTFETYGMSETASLVMIDGHVLPYRECKIENGFFVVGGPVLSPGYILGKTFITHEHWLVTKDKGEEINGRFQFLERADLIFISGGENINPLAVEAVAKKYNGITDAYLVPVPDKKWGDIGVLLYDSQKDINEEEFRTFLRSELHPYQMPKMFIRTRLTFEGALKIKRSDLKMSAYELYLKKIFAYDYYNCPGAKTIVFLHGFLGDRHDLKVMSGDLKSHYSLLYIDLPGHGETKVQYFYDTEDVLSKCADFIRLFDQTPLLYGYSMGGRVALQLALHYLDVKNLFLESSSLGLSSNEELQERKTADLSLFDQYTQNSIHKFLDAWYTNPLFGKYKNHSNYLMDKTRKSKNDLNEWRKSQDFLSQGDFPLLTQNLKLLKEKKMMVIYFYGELDEKYAKYAFILKELGMKAFKILGAAHNPHKTHPLEIKAYLNLLLK